MLKEEEKKTDRLRALSKVPILFRHQNSKKAGLDQEVLLVVDTVSIHSVQHIFVTIIRSQLDLSPSLSVICHKHPIAKSLVFFPRTEH